MNTYQEFKSNPWNFIKKKLKITVDERGIEEQFITNQSNLDYRNFLMYQNNGLKPTFQKLNYEKLISVKSILTIFYVFELDTYIIEIPNKVGYSCISTLIIINPFYSESFKVDLDDYSYGALDLYYLVCTDFKIVYNSFKSTIYIEGNEKSRYNFFKHIRHLESKASIRIYSVMKMINSKMKWKNDLFIPNDNNIIDNKIPLYPQFSLRTKLISEKSYGLNYFIEFIKSTPEEASKLLMKKPTYMSGIIPKDFEKLRGIFTNGINEIGFEIGKRIEKNYTIEDKLYKNRLNNYGYVAILEDCFIGLFFNSNSKSPFTNNTKKRESILIFMNYYCYFIGKTVNEFSYSFSDNRIVFGEYSDEFFSEFRTSYVKFKGDNTYRIRGDFKRTCNSPIIFNDKQTGKYTDYYFINTIPQLNIVEKF